MLFRSIGQTAGAIKSALETPFLVQQEKMSRMRNVLKDHNIYRWASKLVRELAQVRFEET